MCSRRTWRKSKTAHLHGRGCLFRALSYAIMGCESQHRLVRHQIVEHLTTEICWRLLENYIPTDDTIEEYVQRTHMGRNGVWGTSVEMLAFAHLAEVNIASYNNDNGSYHFFGPAVIDPEGFYHDNSRPTVYVVFSGSNHFNVTLSQD